MCACEIGRCMQVRSLRHTLLPPFGSGEHAKKRAEQRPTRVATGVSVKTEGRRPRSGKEQDIHRAVREHAPLASPSFALECLPPCFRRYKISLSQGRTRSYQYSACKQYS